ncbi:hypothetical protein ACFL1H_05025 [Nanoarchaeota archaeon]
MKRILLSTAITGILMGANAYACENITLDNISINEENLFLNNNCYQIGPNEYSLKTPGTKEKIEKIYNDLIETSKTKHLYLTISPACVSYDNPLHDKIKNYEDVIIIQMEADPLNKIFFETLDINTDQFPRDVIYSKKKIVYDEDISNNDMVLDVISSLPKMAKPKQFSEYTKEICNEDIYNECLSNNTNEDIEQCIFKKELIQSNICD